MNSVREEVTGVIIANQVRLERAMHSGSFLLVEGGDDANLFRKFSNLDTCSIIVSSGRKNLLEAIMLLHRSDFEGALGVADRDFCEFIDYPDFEGVVVFTDHNDIEIMTMCSPALLNAIREFGSETRANATAEVSGKNIDEIIFNAACYIGIFRMLSQKEEWFLKFRGMSYRFVDGNSFEIDKLRTVQHVVGRSNARPEKSEADIQQMILDEMERHDVKHKLCCGHDCIRILGRALRKKLGSTNQFNSEEGARNLARVLRLSYEYEFFRDTEMFRSIRKWEDGSGFLVLRN